MALDDVFEACVLCPRSCGVDRSAGQHGVCAADDEMVIARAALHFWEEPPISGEAGSGTVFFSHCPLKCVYCQNHAISRDGAGHRITPEELADVCLDLQRQGAMNINMVTPTHYGPLVRVAISMARSEGLTLPVVWNTSGYESVREIERNRHLVDVYLADFKYMDDALAQAYSGVNDYAEIATAALDKMIESVGPARYDDFKGVLRMTKGVIVRHMLLPGHLDDSKHVVAHLHERYGASIRMSLMNQYTPVLKSLAEAHDSDAMRILAQYPNLAEPVPWDDYEELLDFADEIGVGDYFWQDGETCKESFIPLFE